MEYEIYYKKLLKEFEYNLEYRPKYIYKYYDFEGGYLSLKNSTIQFTHPYKFQDKSEARTNRIKFKNQGQRIKKTLLSESIDVLSTKILGKTIDNTNILKKSYRQIEKEAEYYWENIINKDLGIACFTTLFNSNFHWKNYANNSTGICVKYDFESIINYLNNSDYFKFHNTKSLTHNHVIYVDNIIPIRFGYTREEKLIMGINWALVKSNEYKDEFEYRIYSQNSKIIDGHYRVNINKSAIKEIYIGNNTRLSDIEKLHNLDLNLIE